MAAGEERYSTLEVDNRIQSQPVEQKEHNDSVTERPEGDNPEANEQPDPTTRFSNLEAYHPEYTAWSADEPAALEAYHPTWNEEDQGIIPVTTPDTEPTANNGSVDIQAEDASPSPKKRRICGVSRLVFFLLLALAITISAAAITGALVGTLEVRAHHQSVKEAAASSSTTVAPSATASPTSTSMTASATAIPTYGANVTNCNQNSFGWYAGAQDGECNQANVKQGFEVIALDGNCSVTHYSDYYCTKNATASTLYHCYDLVKSFSVDGCN